MKVTIEIEPKQAAEALESFDDMIQQLRGKTQFLVAAGCNSVLYLVERLKFESERKGARNEFYAK